MIDDELPSAEVLIARRSAARPPSSIIRLKLPLGSRSAPG